MVKKQNILYYCHFCINSFLTHVTHMRNVSNESYAFAILDYIITKTRLYNFDPLKPQFYMRGGSDEYPQSMF